jgi:hypothetical protein
MIITGSTEKPVSYATLDDWHIVQRGFDIPFVDTGDPDSNLLIFIHALIEAYLCSRQGVKETAVNDFDHNYHGKGEPGDEINCPYREQHHAAMMVERYVCRVLEYDWKMHQFRCERAFTERFPNAT